MFYFTEITVIGCVGDVVSTVCGNLICLALNSDTKPEQFGTCEVFGWV